MQRNKYYPTSIKGYHTGRSATIVSLLAIAGGTGILYYLGGPNPALWSNLISGIAWGVSIPIATVVSAIPIVMGTRKFIKARKQGREPKKLGPIEKRLMKRAQRKYSQLELLAMNSDLHMEEMLNGDFSCFQTITKKRKQFWLFGKEISVQKKVYKDQYKYIKALPWGTRRKLHKLIAKINDDLDHLSTDYRALKERKENFEVQLSRAREEALKRRKAELAAKELEARKAAKETPVEEKKEVKVVTRKVVKTAPKVEKAPVSTTEKPVA